MKKLIIFVFLLYLLAPIKAFAESEYVLPYPSVMPGSKWYKLRSIFNELEKYWYFGNLSQFSYNLKQADSYLVEAKTLFEYKQYYLADQALSRSNAYFDELKVNIEAARREGKDVNDKIDIYGSASQKHFEILTGLLETVPEEFNWSPENQNSTNLNLHENIKTAIMLRGGGA